jgi:hypothetical protein
VVDLKDPIQVHLLTETALADSKKYEILPQEEVDNLKKQAQLMMQRVESTRANLAIQAKYRDAALSMAKLAAPGSVDRQAEEDRIAVERKCEELAIELFNVEKSLMVPQRRLLEHTAGILQLTHKASRRNNGPQQTQVVNGIPGSPESLYTFSHSRNSLDAMGDETYFDDSSMYPLDGSRKNPIEIPLKSPHREQPSLLRGEMDRTKEESTLVIRSVAEMEQKLRSLNASLRDTIIRFNPGVNNDYLEPPKESPNAKPYEMLRSQIEYLESGLVAVQAEQESSMGGGNGETDAAVKQLFGVIQDGFASTKQRREERKNARTDKGLPPDEDDEGSDDEYDHNENYSLGAFSNRVRYLSSQAFTLKEQRTVLKRQIKQQRELNNKSDAEKDEELALRQQEVEESRQLVSRAEKDAMDAQKMLSDALQDLEQARAAAAAGSTAQADLQDREETIELLEKKLKKVEAEGKRSEEASVQLQDAMAGKAKAEAATEQLRAEVNKHKSDIEAKNKELKENEDEMEQLNMSLAELKTEVTIARAELDGAYGTRAERAADVAAIKNSAENVKLNNQIEKLKKELAGTAQDLENMTKETLGAEREKVDLESKLDDAIAAKQTVEAEVQKAREQITKLQEELDGEKLKVGGGGSGGSKPGAGASMLSEQFRATMREERKKFQEDLREERARCRKLEEELSRLRRSQGPGKSPLSPR